MIERVEGQCPLCMKPLGPLHPTELVNGVRQHVQPCPEPARLTGERAFKFLPDELNTTSTGGMPRKQHWDRNAKLPPQRPNKSSRG